MQMEVENRKSKSKSKKRSGSLLSGSPPTAFSSPLSSSPSKRRSSSPLKVIKTGNKNPQNNTSSSDSDEDPQQFGSFGWKHLYFNKSQVENLGWLAKRSKYTESSLNLSNLIILNLPYLEEVKYNFYFFQ